MVFPRSTSGVIRLNVCPWMIRHRFNELRILERALRGAALISIIDSDLAPAQANEPAGTTSEFVEYTAGGNPIAKCHRYVRLDGTIGGGGRPDPKGLRVGGEIWQTSHNDRDPPCQDCGVWRPRVREWLRNEAA